MIATVLRIAACFCFVFVAAGINPLPRLNLLGAGLALWVAAELVGPVEINVH